jgi:ribonuclease BN (tRNA processing enzyme)
VIAARRGYVQSPYLDILTFQKNMKLRILGCSGGIGGSHLRTSSLLVDHDVLIDAGTGVADLSIDELAQIDHVFLTHSHLDHIVSLPLMIDTVADLRSKPLVVHATEEVLNILRDHVFNWAIWPDFSLIPCTEKPFMTFQAIKVGETLTLGARHFTALPVDHTVPAVGYQIDSGAASLVISGDTGICDAFWQAVNRIENLRYLIIECAFSNKEAELALRSKHLCPEMLASELEKLTRQCEIFITHLKPAQIELTMQEIESSLSHLHPVMLENNQLFEL